MDDLALLPIPYADLRVLVLLQAELAFDGHAAAQPLRALLERTQGHHELQPETAVSVRVIRTMDPLPPQAAMRLQRAAARAPNPAAAELDRLAKNVDRRAEEQARDAEIVFQYWQAKLNHPRASYSRDRVAKIVARLRDGTTPDELCHAIDGVARSSWHMGANPGGQQYDSIELIFRNREKVEQFASATSAGKLGQPHPYITGVRQAASQAPAASQTDEPEPLP